MATHKHPSRTPRQVLYSEAGRSGTIRYSSQKACFDMWYEFAGGKAVVIINIPSPEEWEASTKTPLSQRKRILNFIGQQVINDRLSSEGYFLIDDDFITVYTGKNPNL